MRCNPTPPSKDFNGKVLLFCDRWLLCKTTRTRVDGNIFNLQHRGVQSFKAIAAMSLNRVIGSGDKIPWHLPEDFRWFKQTTTGHVLVMGRKTFESIGRPLPGRETMVLSRSAFSFPGVTTIRGLDEIAGLAGGRQVFIAGGAQVYQQALPLCSDLFLTLVKREVDGDAFFPTFEDKFELVQQLRDTAEFSILHYQRRN